MFQDHFRSGNNGEADLRLPVELQVVLPQDMSHLRIGVKQRLAAGAHRAVVNGPSSKPNTLNLCRSSEGSLLRLSSFGERVSLLELGTPLANRVVE